MNQAIYKAMRSHLNTLPNKPPIAYLNQPFTPTGAQYMREGFYSAEPNHLAVEYGGVTDYQGFYQIEILTPANSGSTEMTTAEALSEHFKRGMYSGFEVTRCNWVKVDNEGAYSVIRFTAYYRALS